MKIKNNIKSIKNHNIIILEAAVLINANWHFHCHETWVSIIPQEEVKILIYIKQNYVT